MAKQAVGLKPEDRAMIEVHPRPKRKLFPMFPFRLPHIPFLDEQESRLLSKLARLARDRILLFMPFLLRVK
jgi:hypothetical protein